MASGCSQRSRIDFAARFASRRWKNYPASGCSSSASSAPASSALRKWFLQLCSTERAQLHSPNCSCMQKMSMWCESSLTLSPLLRFSVCHFFKCCYKSELKSGAAPSLPSHAGMSQQCTPLPEEAPVSRALPSPSCACSSCLHPPGQGALLSSKFLRF